MYRIFRRLSAVTIDILCIYIAFFASLLMRFDGSVPVQYHNSALLQGIIFSFVFITIVKLFDLYKSLWKYLGTKELFMICCASLSATTTSMMCELLFIRKIPISVFIINGFIVILLVGGVRILYGFILKNKTRQNMQKSKAKAVRTMIVGAGDAGLIILREMKNNPKIISRPVIFIDDDEKKQGAKIQGIMIAGNTDTIIDNVNKYNIDEIIFSMPSANAENKKRILQICAETGCKLLTLPPISRFFSGNGLQDILRPVNLEDLLGRDEIDLDIAFIAGYLNKKTVLITGGGGSIGSEIARQLLKFDIKKLLLLDIYENNVYELLNELRMIYGTKSDIEILIASIRDRERLEEIFADYRPDIIFHAAAHKHVPLMETNPGEAIKNNILGTINLVDLADQYQAEKFILISSDKAVNPTSIMGATKRVAEMIVQAIERRSKTKFAAVRFGNVLGSNGSVIPLFKKQIESGGPVTVTHPEIERFFMTISEASQLVIEAGAIAKGGEIFVLDMGESVKIIDLAKNMIRLSGFVPEVDIKIEITGLRPGEKMYEELLYTETIQKTIHNKIYIENPHVFSYDDVISKVLMLINSLGTHDSIREAILKVVPRYHCESYMTDKDTEIRNIG